jgi:hypothetical protein
MNKKIKLIVVSLILLVIVGINISYAISIPGTSSFFEVNKTEVVQGETLEMTIDLSKIDYKQFEFILNSNIEIENVYTNENGIDDSDIKLDQESNDIAINIDKENLNLSKIVLYYQIPEDIELGTTIQLNAQVEVENEVAENQEKNETENDTSEGQETGKTVVDTEQIEITIVEKDNEDNQNQEIINPEENINKEQQENQLNETKSKNQNDMQNMQGTNSNQVVSAISSMQSMINSGDNAKTSVTQVETVTYNGSNNNYLSSLEIDGVQLTSDFNKETSTYFATVEGLETITVTANAEDSNSKVAITGTTLKSGENKILISVTAENSDVRYYRIYVTKN